MLLGISAHPGHMLQSNLRAFHPEVRELRRMVLLGVHGPA